MVNSSWYSTRSAIVISWIFSIASCITMLVFVFISSADMPKKEMPPFADTLIVSVRSVSLSCTRMQKP